MIEVIEWSAFALGTIGTIAWAAGFKLNGRAIEGWFWLASALLWIWFAVLNKHSALAARDLLGVALYAAGIFNSFRPRKIFSVDLIMNPEVGCAICASAMVSGPGSRELRMREACVADRKASQGLPCIWRS